MDVPVQIPAGTLAWLLEPADPGVRFLALRDLCRLPESDPQLREARREAHRAGPIAAVLAGMEEPGFWMKPGPGYNPKYRSTVWALILLAQLGAAVDEDERIARACTYLLDHALTPGGQFTATGAPSGTIDCLQGNLCWALSALGCRDERLEGAYQWMARSITGDGVAPREDQKAAVRYYAGQCGPGFACGGNYGEPCAWGAVKEVLALAQKPAPQRSRLEQEAAAAGVDFLLGVDPATAGYPSGPAGRPNRSWWKFGFPVFYITDVLQILEALAAHGLGADPRLATLRALILGKRDAQGRWRLEYDYSGKTWVEFGEKGQPNKWVTLRALRALEMAA